MVFRKVYIVLCAALLAAGDLCAQQVRVEPRIAGLEGNREYMSLLEQDAQLQIREDSIVNAVERARQQLREDPANRQRYSQEILQLESRIFEVRNAKGRLIDKINTIEQEWVLANLNGAAQQPAEPAAEKSRRAIPDSLRCATWFSTPISASSCPRPIMRPAQGAGAGAGRRGLCEPLFCQLRTICELAEAWCRGADRGGCGRDLRPLQYVAGLQPRAGRFTRRGMELYRRQQRVCLWLSDGQMGQDAILAREEKRLSGLPANSRHCAARSLRMPWPIISCARKSSWATRRPWPACWGSLPPATRCAAWLRNWMASTSACPVSTWRSAISSTTTVSRSPQRQNTATSTRSPSAGSTSTGRSTVSCWARSIPSVPSPRSGAYPLSYLVGEDKKWCYYAGASQPGRRPRPRKTVEIQRLRPPRNRGVDGRRLPQPSRDPEAQQIAYRVEITGTEALPDVVKTVITEAAEGANSRAWDSSCSWWGCSTTRPWPTAWPPQ